MDNMPAILLYVDAVDFLVIARFYCTIDAQGILLISNSMATELLF